VTTTPTDARLRSTIAAIGAASLLALSACSSSSGSATPTASASGSAGATPTASSQPTAPTSSGPTAGDPKGLGVTVEVSGSSGTLTADQKAAVSMWSQYWHVTMASFNSQGGTLDANLANLDAVATGTARSDAILGSSNRLRKGMYTVGTVRFTVIGVEVSGSAVALRACAHDQSYEINSQGLTVVAAKGDTAVNGQLTKTATGWRVSGTAKVSGGCPAGS
jgi:hypothetical protein